MAREVVADDLGAVGTSFFGGVALRGNAARASAKAAAASRRRGDTNRSAAPAIAPLVDVGFETLRIWIEKALAEGAKPAGRTAGGLSAPSETS